MIIPSDESYFRLVDQLKDKMGFPSDLQVRVYSDWSQAVFETVLGVAHFMSHKKSMGILKGRTFAWNPILSFLYREAFQVQPIPQGGEHSPESLRQWLETAKKDTLFVLHQTDHPISGEIYSSEFLDNALNERKIFSVRISHQPSSLDQLQVGPYSAHIQIVSERLSLVILGSKCKFPMLFSSHQSPAVLSPQILETEFQKYKSNEIGSDKVSSFETQLGPNFFAPFSKISQRRSGSMVFGCQGINGDFLAHELKKAIPDLEVKTLSRCFWKAPLSYKDWWDAAPSDEVLNQLIVIPSCFAEDIRLREFFRKFNLNPEMIV
jgi:hypothetical protein